MIRRTVKHIDCLVTRILPPSLLSVQGSARSRAEIGSKTVHALRTTLDYLILPVVKRTAAPTALLPPLNEKANSFPSRSIAACTTPARPFSSLSLLIQ